MLVVHDLRVGTCSGPETCIVEADKDCNIAVRQGCHAGDTTASHTAGWGSFVRGPCSALCNLTNSTSSCAYGKQKSTRSCLHPAAGCEGPSHVIVRASVGSDEK